MNKYKKLAGNSLILTIGNFGSKFINFFLVPLYTALLSTADYGTIDIMITTVALLLPVLTLEVGQATIRFAVQFHSKKGNQLIFSNLLFFAIILTAIIVGITPILNILNIFEGYTSIFSLMLIFQLYNILLLNYVRGIQKLKEFAFNGILTTVVTVCSNIYLLVYLDWGVNGYLFSIIISLFISSIYLLYVVSKSNGLKLVKPNKALFVEMVQFSTPLVPNSIMWWLINGSTRYFILVFVGVSGNGLFAVANKIPSIISSIMTVFMQSWQLSSFEEYDSEDRDLYYSNVFKTFSSLLFLIASLLVFTNKFIMSLFVADSFFESWKYVSILIIGVVFQSFSNFLGTIYSASKVTKKAFSTTIYGGIASLLANILLVPAFGVSGAALSVALSFIILFVIRIIDSKKYVNIEVNYTVFSLNCLLLLFQIIIQYFLFGLTFYIIEFVLFMIILIVNYRTLIKLYKQMAKKR